MKCNCFNKFQVIDGISLAVNHVQINFNCDAFTSSVQVNFSSVTNNYYFSHLKQDQAALSKN